MFFNRSQSDWTIREREKQIKMNKQYERRLAIEQRKSNERKKKNEIREIKLKNKLISGRHKKVTTSKFIMYTILINCSVIELYAMWVMYHFADLSALYALIGAVISESLSYAIYSAKAYKENHEKYFYSKEKRNEVDATLYDDPELDIEDNSAG